MHFLIDPKLLLMMLVGTWAGTIGTTVLIGGGIAGGIAASKKKKKEPTRIEDPYQTAEMLQYQKSLQDRLAGRGLSSDILNRSVSPFATSLRDKFLKYTTPNIKSAASAAGVGRSTIPVAQIGQKSQETEQSIDKRLADLMYKNEFFKLEDRLAAEKEIAGVGQGKTDVLNSQLAENARARDVARAETKENVNRYLTGVGGFISGGAGGAVTSYGGYGNLTGLTNTKDVDSTMSIIDKILGSRAGTVNIAGNDKYSVLADKIRKPSLSYS